MIRQYHTNSRITGTPRVVHRWCVGGVWVGREWRRCLDFAQKGHTNGVKRVGARIMCRRQYGVRTLDRG